jgi:putative protease
VTPELLAPAGCWESLRAAVANGADAVYFGVEVLNARLRAENFQAADLPEVMEWLHRRGVRGFLTVNVLLFPSELEAAGELVLQAAAAGVDALIVQDIGLARLARQLAPGLALHGSTQMSITSAAGVAQAAELGCERVVLARELTLKDFSRLRQQLDQRGCAMPLEVFVHGALCVAYSGQCLTSEALGQRSANRGECAQACRLPYQLIVDGVERDLGEQRYLLSPQDLAAWELLPDLADVGIASLKIEGRLKDASYVAAVTQAYRQGLDALAAPVTPAQAASPAHRLQPKPPGGAQAGNQPLDRDQLRRRLELSFSRGLGTGWLQGVDHQQLVHGRWSKKRGPWVGRLDRIEAGGWLVLPAGQPLKTGDGLVLEGAGNDPLQAPQEVGGRVMALQTRAGGLVALQLGPGRVDLAGLKRGSPCWLTSDPQLESQLQKLAQAPAPERQQALDLWVSGALGMPLLLEVAALAGTPGGPWRVASATPLEAASGAGLDRQRLEQQLGRLGGTPWQLGQLAIDLDAGLFLPVAQLNALRRQLVELLAKTHQAGQKPPGAEASVRPANPGAGAGATPGEPGRHQQIASALGALLPRAGAPRPQNPADAGWEAPAEPGVEPTLTVLVRSLEQLEALLEQPIHRVVVDIEHPNQLRQAVAMGRGRWAGGLWLAGQRICRPDERWSLEPLLRAQPDGYLVRNADQLERLSLEAPCIGDFSLNVANPLTAAWLLQRWGLERITASYDLALDQLLELVAGCPPGRVELTLHQHMPLFHMEHCLFCAFLSEGHDHSDCGRPCEQHQVLLRDRSGTDHPLRADLGCRNTLFNGKAQTGAEAIPALLRAGLRHYRIELLQDNAADAIRRVELYRQALAGQRTGRQVWQQEQLDSRLGVTRGSLNRRGG